MTIRSLRNRVAKLEAAQVNDITAQLRQHGQVTPLPEGVRIYAAKDGRNKVTIRAAIVCEVSRTIPRDVAFTSSPDLIEAASACARDVVRQVKAEVFGR